MTDRTSDSDPPQAQAASGADLYLDVLSWLIPAFRHDVRGSLNSTVLNLEVARRALGRSDIAKSQAAIDRAVAESRRLSAELPRLMSWFGAAEVRDFTRTCDELRAEIETLAVPALRRHGLALADFEVPEQCRDHQLSDEDCRRVLMSLGGLALAMVPSDAERSRSGPGNNPSEAAREVKLSVRPAEDGVKFEFETTPRFDEEDTGSILERLGGEPCRLTHSGGAFELEATDASAVVAVDRALPR